MIECDSCKEWFHGQCIGLSEDQNNIQSYICIGCAKAFYNFDPAKLNLPDE